jgi:hypothetical protein
MSSAASQSTKNEITLRGSVEIVTEFFGCEYLYTILIHSLYTIIENCNIEKYFFITYPIFLDNLYANKH